MARGRPRPTRRDTHPVGTSNTPGVPTRLATARQVRKRFTIWVLRLGGRALALADRPRKASMSPARDAPMGHGEAEPTMQTCRPQCPCNRTASAKTVYDLGPTPWRPRAGLDRSSKKCEHVAGARRAKGPGAGPWRVARVTRPLARRTPWRVVRRRYARISWTICQGQRAAAKT